MDLDEIKTIYLLRHAKAPSLPSQPDDFLRELDYIGKRECKELKQYLESSFDPKPEVVTCSDSVRTKSTFENIKSTFTNNPEVLFTNDLYNTHALHILELLQTMDEKYKTIMLIGHNPGINDIVFAMRAICPTRIINDAKNYDPTCKLVKLQMKAAEWREILEKDVNVVDVFTPKVSRW